jgi:hypothetical protein
MTRGRTSSKGKTVIQTSHYCATCQRRTLHTKARINHVLHLVLSVLTAGVWLVVWAILGASNSAERTRCTVCGSKPGAGALRHEVASAFGSATSNSGRAGEVPASTWLPPGARPPRG